jgi:hypothetical protein
MKRLKTVLLCCICFLAAAAVTCFLRAKYGWLPDLKATYAYAYIGNVQRYSFLQYNQATPEQGRAALLQYLNLLERIRSEHIAYSANLLHRDFALTYLRLYRLESAAGNSSTADNYMKSAQKELLAQGAQEKQVSAEALAKLIAARELRESEVYNNTRAPVQEKKTEPSKKTSE